MARRNTIFEDEKIEKQIDIHQLGKTLRYILPYRKILVLVIAMMLISSVVSLLPPRMLKYIVDVVAVEGDYKQLLLVGLGMVLLAIVEIGTTFLQTRVMGNVGFSVITNIRRDIFHQLQKLGFEYFDNRPDGKIVVRVTEYINNLADFFTNYVVMFIIYIVKIVVVTVFMLSMSPQLTLIIFATVIPMMLLVMWLRRTLKPMYSEQRAKNSNRTAFLVEAIMGERIVKNYNRIEKNKETYREIHEDSADWWFRIVKRSRLNSPIVMGFWNAGTVALYGVSLALILAGNDTISAGMILVFTSYMAAFQDPISQLSTIIQELAQVSSNLEQVFDTMDYPVDIFDKEGAVTLQNVKGQVDFSDVTFAYEDDENVLEHFNLHVSPGETIALVGPTGAGKTTVINMLTRFYDVKSGSVKIDGYDVRDIRLQSLRKEFGVLMQEPFIFKGTILENIRYGKREATDEECIAAAKAIYADAFVQKFPDGYEHMLEEKGAGLSSGEKQLLSFARIILKNPSVIILDEATSAIDTETESLIQSALEVIIKDKTAFVVAHRLSTIKNADRILYISNKGIAEEGTHEQLMTQKGLYYELAR